MDKIERKLAGFRYKVGQCALSDSEKQHYIEIEKQILQSEQMSARELLARARKIKPLVRVEGSELAGYRKKQDNFRESDIMCFCKPCDIRRRSYLYNFTPEQIVMCKGKIFKVPMRQKVGEFTCYHNTGGHYGILLPSVDEVLQQLPPEYDWQTIDAFELSFPSLDVHEVYDSILDRHVSTVILYRFEHGLPPRLKAQDIIFDGHRYHQQKNKL